MQYNPKLLTISGVVSKIAGASTIGVHQPELGVTVTAANVLPLALLDQVFGSLGQTAASLDMVVKEDGDDLAGLQTLFGRVLTKDRLVRGAYGFRFLLTT